MLEKGLLNFLVVPLMAGPEDFTLEEVQTMPLAAQVIVMKDHTMEKDKETIMSLLESFVLLCSTAETREFLRQSQTYPILREFDNKQTDELIKEEVLKIVDLLVRDEGEEVVHEPTKDAEEEEEVDLNMNDLGLGQV